MIVIENGEIVEFDDPAALLRRDSRFRALTDASVAPIAGWKRMTLASPVPSSPRDA